MMGASGWSYLVPYEADIGSALTKLKAKVRKSGKHYKGSPEDGTHSILDISKVSATPVASDADPGFGVVAPLPDAELVELLGTAQPSRAKIQEFESELREIRSRWMGTYVVVYKADSAHELWFTGFSGD